MKATRPRPVAASMSPIREYARAARTVTSRVGASAKETEPWEIIFFKLYKSQLPAVEQALETTALMLGSDKSRGYCLEMICADFLAGAATQGNQSEVLVLCLERLYKTLPDERKDQLCSRIREGPWGNCVICLLV
jgi:hypothetical protein